MTIKRCYPVLVGASVVENQLCNGESVTVSNGHKFYLKKSGTESLGASTGTAITGLTSGSDMVIDLTQKFGSAIAGYVYSLETATAGAGIAKLRSWGFLTSEYIPYNAGTLESVEATAHVTVGFNQFDASTITDNAYIGSTGAMVTEQPEFFCSDYIRVLPNTAYYSNTDVNARIYTHILFDADKNFIDKNSTSKGTLTTPQNAYYMRVNAIKSKVSASDICVSLSSERNGEYEPYKSITYSLGNDTLRGIFKLDANNNLYADGDRKEADGTITRYYGTREYQEGDESLVDAITDGTTTVYKLTTPTTETSTPFTSPQIVYPDGTEEFVTENGVPVGHETKYQL